MFYMEIECSGYGSSSDEMWGVDVGALVPCGIGSFADSQHKFRGLRICFNQQFRMPSTLVGLL